MREVGDMIELEALTAETSRDVLELTYPRYRCLLESFNEAGLVASCAFLNGRPVGLALAERDDKEVAVLLSLYVLPALRRLGIGMALMVKLEETALQKGLRRFRTVYADGKGASAAFQHILVKRNWTEPTARLVLVRASVVTVMQHAPWLSRNWLNSDLRMIPWEEVPACDRDSLQQDWREQGWTESPDPCEVLETATSLALLHGDQTIGCLLMHRIGADTLRYSMLYIKSEHRKPGRSMALICEAIIRQFKNCSDRPFGVMGIHAANIQMLKFMRNKVIPWAEEVTKTKDSTLSLYCVPV
jgi:GNAT superfamily N-acetyltransferase